MIWRPGKVRYDGPSTGRIPPEPARSRQKCSKCLWKRSTIDEESLTFLKFLTGRCRLWRLLSAYASRHRAGISFCTGKTRYSHVILADIIRYSSNTNLAFNFYEYRMRKITWFIFAMPNHAPNTNYVKQNAPLAPLTCMWNMKVVKKSSPRASR
jgi:hypothetical protein